MTRAKLVVWVAVLTLPAGLFGAAALPPVGSHEWVPLEPMADARSGAAAVLLPDGRVLVTGGSAGGPALASAEVFDPVGGWSAVAPMTAARSGHAAVALKDGRVLVVGGTGADGAPTTSAEVFDPASGAWAAVGSMIQARSGHTASLLSDGRVVIAGGATASLETFDQKPSAVPSGSSVGEARTGHGTAALPAGRAVIAGSATASLEIFDPKTSAFTSDGSLAHARTGHGAAVLPDGKVLIAGGSDGAAPLASTAIYDPATRASSVGPALSVPRDGASVTGLLNGEVLVAGGYDGAIELATAEVYDPVSGSFSAPANQLWGARRDHLAVRLPNNNSVLIVGGSTSGVPLPTAELFVPWQNSFQATGSPFLARTSAAGSPLGVDGRLVLVGGSDGGSVLASAEMYGFATVKTDKDDYAPGETVIISGSGWEPGETVTLLLHEDVNPPFHEDRTLRAVADAAGNIVNDKFRPVKHDIAVRFYLTATGANSQAQTTFTDGFAVSDFKQCANEDPTLGSCHWITSIVQSQNSNYAEGMDNPQRLVFTGIDDTTNDEHTLLFDHEATKGGIHAYDWLTSYAQAQADSAAAGIPLTLNECGQEIGPPAGLGATCAALRAGAYFLDVEVPDDPYLSADGPTQTRIDAYEALRGNRTIRIWGNAPITAGSLNLTHNVADEADTGNSQVDYVLNWTSASTEVLIEMAGHIAMANTAAGWGAGKGASSISGGPYHFSLKSLDGDSSGAQDNPIKGADLIEPASITIIKDTVPNGEQDFAYTTTGTGLSPFTLDDNGNNADGTSNTQVFSGIISFGNKVVTETLPVAGYDLTNIVCSGDSNLLIGADDNFDPGDSSVTIDLDEGETIICTYTNTKDATVQIIKDAVPNDPQDFAYTTTGTDSDPTGFTAGFSLDDDANITLPNTRTFTFPAAQLGAKTVVEGAVPGWSLTGLVCSGDDNSSVDPTTRTATLDVDAGETIICTYTNTKHPTIIVRKITTGTAGGPFDFTTVGGNGLSATFSLTTVTPGVAVEQSFPIAVTGIGGNYSVTESVLAPNFVFTDVGCVVTVTGVAGTIVGSTAATKTGTITNLTAGTTVTCTFINSGALTTRTQGFWATHLSLVQQVWSPTGGVIDTFAHNGMTAAEMTICPAGSPYLVGPLTVEQVMGGFWSRIAKTSTGDNRSAIDRARMRLLQQLLAAILNDQLFGSSPTGTTIDQAKAEYCTGTIEQIMAAQSAMASFNENGDDGLFTPGASAMPREAKALADYVFWDVLP